MTSTQAIRDERQALLEAEEARKTKAATMAHKFAVPIPDSIEGDIEDRLKRIQERFYNPPTQPQMSGAERDYRKQELLRQAQLPSLHEKRTQLDGEQWQECFNAKLKPRLGSGFLLALIGVRGSGKTQLGVCLIRENAERLKSSRFTTAMDIFLAIKSTYRRDSTTDEKAIVDEFCKPRLLVIDEIQERAESPWEDRILTHLINRRYNDEKDTLLIGNFTLDAFKDAMGASVLSRLNETGGIISCDWESFRK